MADDKPTRWRRRCMVQGCPEYGRWQYSDTEPPSTEDPTSHYAREHALDAADAYQHRTGAPA